jgi:predicted secreted Zn-dependent protease
MEFREWGASGMLRGILVAAGMVALAAGLVPTFGTEPAVAEVRSNIRYSGYPVRGLTAQEIWRDIGRKGPHQAEYGLYAQAEAEIRYGWEVAFASVGGICRAESAMVYVDVNIRLPDWVDKARGSQELRNAWNRYISKVRRHEDHHKDIALAAAREIDRAITAAPPQRSCRALEHDIKAVANRILAWERTQQAHFDRTDKPIMLMVER